ncbi:hypothetical protein K458DRAFT_459578 [Lentithecium fluviatile CBS 122367]|uniref:BTB domain-containing protein n=1 Tax=Lentithecium fluviatile CBS 122367 TaxID=1168545 RepID=A0A6G1JJI5_9PLEO|nr:hypothetical protein K458DRAFT_459578 [Lentithecium fluviatile CBS 122367]
MTMALESFVRDLSSLRTGILSDLVLHFGEKSWNIHRAIACCHSKWFQKALTVGLEESESRVITLQDSIIYADAIDSMVSYFYRAGYDASTCETSEPLLHAQVAIIADKYDCASLYGLAENSFAATIKAVEIDDWAVIATFIHDHTISEAPAHAKVRTLVATAMTDRPSVFRSALRNKNVLDLLQSNADLATDLLLNGQAGRQACDEDIFMCGFCNYGHFGSRKCLNATPNTTLGATQCPQCQSVNGTKKGRYEKMNICPAYPCPLCNGHHTVPPQEL